MTMIYYPEIEEIINSVIDNSYCTEYDRIELFDIVESMPRYMQSILRDSLVDSNIKDARQLKEMIHDLINTFQM